MKDVRCGVCNSEFANYIGRIGIPCSKCLCRINVCWMCKVQWRTTSYLDNIVCISCERDGKIKEILND